ncbi:gamma-glutamyltransferase [Paenibacillus hemerocallicola]|uniref:gamma-glutamyltransferase n=1 Tax=Paenibacillus hemerocallicola TaxID=1172614 RepID=UPI00159ECE27|nr:gamma-glutamyltransferase [Paenibacillus hemerocallicola]
MTIASVSYGIVASPHPLAADAGLAVLEAGGSAIDAAVAAAFAHTVVTPSSCGIAGYAGTMIFYCAERNQVLAVDFNSRAPAAARENMFAVEQDADGRTRVPGQANSRGALSVDIPGTVSGLVLAQEKFGSLPLNAVLQPAIRAAREGFPVSSALANTVTGLLAAKVDDFPEIYRLYSIDGRPPREGEILRCPELADTLERIAEAGASAFYEGEIARRIVDTVQSHGGIVTLDDLAAYRAKVVQPIHTGYRDYEVFTPPLGAGGLTVLQALRVLEGFDVAGTQGGAKLLHLLTETAKAVFRERLTKYGDPEITGSLTEYELGEELIQKLRNEVAEGLKKPSKGRIIAPHPSGGTIHLVTADRHRNVVSLTLTHGEAFGSLLAVPGTGIVLPHGMSRFDPRPGWPNSVGPSKQPLHNMSPVLAMKNGHPALALGAAGGRTIVNSVYTVLTRVIDLGLSLPDALKEPRFHVETREPVWVEEGDEELAAALTRLGHEVEIKPSIGILQGIEFNLETGSAHGASDTRSPGKVAWR